MLEPKNNAQLPAIPGKRYFTIGEVSELCGVKPHVLRYWEQEFPQLKPVKRRGNRRYYQRQDVIVIRQIRSLLYDQGFTIGGARNKLERRGSAHRRDAEPADRASRCGVELEDADEDPAALKPRPPPRNARIIALIARHGPHAARIRSPVEEEQSCRSVAQSGSALAWGARGPEFKSRRSDQ